MQNFLRTLRSESENVELPEEFNYFGKLTGSWKIDHIDNSNSRSIKGEWHFSWILDGIAQGDGANVLFNYSITIPCYSFY